MQIKNGASNEILKTLANRVVQGQKGDQFLAGSTFAAANLTDFAQMLDKFNEKANLNDAASKFTGGEASSFLLNLQIYPRVKVKFPLRFCSSWQKFRLARRLLDCPSLASSSSA